MIIEEQEIKEGSLVCVKYRYNLKTGKVISTDEEFFDVDPKQDRYSQMIPLSNLRSLRLWFEVLFIDEDYFIGELKSHQKNKWSEVEVVVHDGSSHVKIPKERISDVASLNQQFCYSDETLRCECSGLCREK